jgi:DNA-binding response OmpR family regulator
MSKSATVLLIDDDRDIAEGAAIRLRAAGYRVLWAGGGRLGVHLAVRHRPDVILLDVYMPSGDGLKALTWLRQQEETERTPVVVFSADSAVSRRALALGAQYYVKKPYESKSLLATVDEAIRSVARNKLPPLHLEIHAPGAPVKSQPKHPGRHFAGNPPTTRQGR